jgi:hypothetical protein
MTVFWATKTAWRPRKVPNSSGEAEVRRRRTLKGKMFALRNLVERILPGP